MDTQIDTVQRIARAASDFYIGRTGNPQRRLLQHRHDKGHDHLYSLYWDASRDQVAAFEQALIQRFAHFKRCVNLAPDSRGRWSEGPACIYITWSFQNQPWDDVNEHQPSLITAPPPSPTKLPSWYLRTPLSPTDAANALHRARRR